jgi:elongation factor Tu
LRAIAPFIQVARFSLRKPQNPLISLQLRNTSPVLSFCRTYAVFERTKPHVNIGTIGHVDHGKVHPAYSGATFWKYR